MFDETFKMYILISKDLKIDLIAVVMLGSGR